MSILIEHKLGMKGEMRCILYDPDMSVVQDTGWFDNLIVDNGLEIYETENNVFRYTYVGTGTTPTVVGMTSMESLIPGGYSSTTGNGNGIEVYNGISPYEFSKTLSRRFLAGVGTGTISEIGIGEDTLGANIFNRQLVTPSPISKGASQILDVIFRLTYYPPIGDTLSSGLTIDGIDYNTISHGSNYLLLSNVTEVFTGPSSNQTFWAVYDGDIGATVEDRPSGDGGGGVPAQSSPAYIPGSYYKDFKMSYSIDAGNPPLGIRSIESVFNSCWMQTQFGDAPAATGNRIPKDNTKEFDITVRLSWDRH